MERIDLKKDLASLYRVPAGRIVEVEVPPLRYLTVGGQGDPNTSQTYADAVEALFSVSYAAKFLVRRGHGVNYGVMPLEGLWWADDMAAFTVRDKAVWKWTMMILQPDVASDEVVAEAIAGVRSRKNLPALDRLRLETFAEGRCAQTLHIGPFDEEGPTIERLHAFIDERSQRRGTHHEIYFTDVRRAAPENWKTLLRQPMA